MGTLTLKIKYGVNDGLILSPSELIEGYLFGIPLCYKDGRELTQHTIKQKLQIAQEQLEKYLTIKFMRQIVTDNVDFIRNEWGAWSYIKCSYLVREALQMQGFINTTMQIQYPLEWVSITQNAEDYRMGRNIHIVPAGSSSPVTTNAIIFNGITPNLGFLGLQNIPNYWKIKYCTGFTKMPMDLLDIVGKLASIQLLALLGDVLLGIGATSQSLSVDGLSQSTSLSRSGQSGLFGGRIKQYGDELKADLLQARNNYIGISFGVM